MAKSKMKCMCVGLPLTMYTKAAAEPVIDFFTGVFPEPAVIVAYQISMLWAKAIDQWEGHVAWYEGAVAPISLRGIKRMHWKRVVEGASGAAIVQYGYDSEVVIFPEDCRPQIKEDGMVTVEVQVLNEDVANDYPFQMVVYFWYYEK